MLVAVYCESVINDKICFVLINVLQLLVPKYTCNVLYKSLMVCSNGLILTLAYLQYPVFNLQWFIIIMQFTLE